MADDLVERVINSVQAVVAKAVAEAERRIDERFAHHESVFTAALEFRIGNLPQPQKGDKGDAGKDAEPVDLEEIERKIKVLLEAIPRPRDGTDGKDGANPEPAAIVELIRPEIEKEIALGLAAMPLPKNGTDGQDGQDGKDGERGEAGRDALELDVLKGISNDRSYARGTWASFDGSLWVATRQTIPLADKSVDSGWRCVVAGMSDLAFDFNVESRRMLIQWKQGGARVEQTVEIPVLLDRGVYRPEMKARAGDVVSHDGSAWVARATTTEIPGTSKDWRLLVMRGRNGKDAERAARIDGPVHLR